MNNEKRKLFPTAFLAKEIFSLIGFIFAILFTIRGICQVIYIFAENSLFAPGIQNGIESRTYLQTVFQELKNQYFAVLDMLLMILCIFMLVHGALGVYYAIRTNYNIRNMLKKKVWFYLQIISAIAAGLVILNLTNPAGEIATHSVISWIICIIISLLGSFHFANGLYNACITLGICVSARSLRIARIAEWIVAIFSMLQIFILLI